MSEWENFCDFCGITAKAQVLISQLTPCCSQKQLCWWCHFSFSLARTFLTAFEHMYEQNTCSMSFLYVLCSWLWLVLHCTVNPQSMALGEPGAWLVCLLFCEQMLGFLFAWAQNIVLSVYGETPFQWETIPNVVIHTSSFVHWQNALEGYQTLKGSFFFFFTLAWFLPNSICYRSLPGRLPTTIGQPDTFREPRLLSSG